MLFQQPLLPVMPRRHFRRQLSSPRETTVIFCFLSGGSLLRMLLLRLFSMPSRRMFRLVVTFLLTLHILRLMSMFLVLLGFLVFLVLFMFLFLLHRLAATAPFRGLFITARVV